MDNQYGLIGGAVAEAVGKAIGEGRVERMKAYKNVPITWQIRLKAYGGTYGGILLGLGDLIGFIYLGVHDMLPTKGIGLVLSLVAFFLGLVMSLVLLLIGLKPGEIIDAHKEGCIELLEEMEQYQKEGKTHPYALKFVIALWVCLFIFIGIILVNIYIS